MKKNKNDIVALIGEKKYDEEAKLLQKLIDQEAKQGKFREVVGDVDEREDSLKLPALSQGFET